MELERRRAAFMDTRLQKSSAALFAIPTRMKIGRLGCRNLENKVWRIRMPCASGRTSSSIRERIDCWIFQDHTRSYGAERENALQKSEQPFRLCSGRGRLSHYVLDKRAIRCLQNVVNDSNSLASDSI